MTEAEWDTCQDIDKMLRYLLRLKLKKQLFSLALPGTIPFTQILDRKLRLFGCLCIRGGLGFSSPAILNAISIAEKYADGLATKRELKKAEQDIIAEAWELEDQFDAPGPDLLAPSLLLKTRVAKNIRRFANDILNLQHDALFLIKILYSRDILYFRENVSKLEKA